MLSHCQANILLDNDLNAKLADFGISKLAPVQATHVSTAAVGTMGYMIQSITHPTNSQIKSDVYSFGVVLLELISAKAALDLSRGGEECSLVKLATHIKKGDLEGLLDPALLETYTDPAGHGRESVLIVGKLALKCVDMRPEARPTMSEVLKDLQNLWVELSGTSEHMDSLTRDDHEESHEDDNGDLQCEDTILFSNSFATKVALVRLKYQNSLHTSDQYPWPVDDEDINFVVPEHSVVLGLYLRFEL